MINRLTIQQQKIAQRKALSNAIYPVPLQFKPKQISLYPPDNTQEFEWWLKENLKPGELIGKERAYLPVTWTAYWCNNGYGTREKQKLALQKFVDSLPRDRKFFSVCQYDDGPMVDFKDLDIKIFGMSGGRIDYPIPLLCCPHKYEFPHVKKDIFCSFVGSDTHPIRRELVKEFEGKKDCYVTLKKLNLKDYCEILARSVFALAPRGYGKNSFRCQEAIQYGAIPVYISDDWIIPYEGFGKAFYLLKPGDNIYQFLKTASTETSFIKEYAYLYTYAGCKQKILENI
jgi:hypothetical protein